MKTNSNRKLLPLVTALCVFVLAAVSCRNVMLEQKLRNPNKRTTSEVTQQGAYYVSATGDDDNNDGIAYSTPYKTLRKALYAVQSSGGKMNRVIVIGTLTYLNADGLTGADGVFCLDGYGTAENPITISGTNGGTLDGETNDKSVMSISNCNLRFENITFTHGIVSINTDGGGLHINCNSKVTLLNGARIISNTATGKNGGGIYVEDATLTVDGAEITNNKSNNGGGLYAGSGAKVEIKSGSFTVNTASSDGGAVYVDESESFIMKDGSISANTANDNGGGIYSKSGGKIQINGGTIYCNTANGGASTSDEHGGGGIYFASGSPVIRGAKIQNNSATGTNRGSGGGVFVAGGMLTMDGAEISDNTARGAADYSGGGGVYVKGGANIEINSGTIKGNKATGGNSVGGGICLRYNSSSTLTLNYADVSYNSGEFGGGIHIGGNNTGQINGGIIHDNTGTNSGGGIHCGADATLNLYGGEIVSNTSDRGGGVFISASLRIDGAEIMENTATQQTGGCGGGGICALSDITFISGKITGNSDFNSGGNSIFNYNTNTSITITIPDRSPITLSGKNGTNEEFVIP